MAMYTVECPKCAKLYRVDGTNLGKAVACAVCQTQFIPVLTDQTPDRLPPSASAPQSAADGHRRVAADGVPEIWAEGDVILDLYEVKGLLGEGGMGQVYRVHHRGWNLDLAVKCPKPDSFQTDGQKENFEAECETWINLGLHPHIVSCYYVRALGGIPRVFAECVEGRSMQDWIDTGTLYEGGPDASLQRTLDIAIQFAWGLHYAHEHQQGLIHQDVKPANVLMTPSGIAKVSDFGLAKARAAAGEAAVGSAQQSILVSSGGMTPAFCSPEQANGEKLSRKTDLWSWAVSVLEMFTGEVTWPSGSVADQALEAYLEMGLGDTRLPAMPEGVVSLLRHCLQRDPSARPRDLHEVAGVLQEAYGSLLRQEYPRQEPKAAAIMADGLNNRAVSLMDLGKSNEAESAWQRALAVDPQHLQSVYNLGLLQWRGGRIDDVTTARRLRGAGASAAPWRVAVLAAQRTLESGDAEETISLLERLNAGDLARREVQSLLAHARRRLPVSGRLLRVFKGSARAVNSVSLSADGRYALSGNSDKTLTLWDVSNGDYLRTFEQHTSHVLAVVLRADGVYALSGSRDHTVKLWEVSSGRCLRTFEGHTESVNSVSLSADGRYALSGSGAYTGSKDNTLKLWEVSSGRCLRTFEGHTESVNSVSLSADGRYVLSGSGAYTGSKDNTLKLWEVSSGRCLRTFEGHTESVNSARLSGDRCFAVSGSSDGTIKLWEVVSGHCLRTLNGHTSGVQSVFLSAGGRYALSGGSDWTLKLWDVSSGCCLRTFEGHTAGVTSVVLSPGARQALSGSDDGTLMLWNTGNGAARKSPWEMSGILGTEAAAAVESQFQEQLDASRLDLEQGDSRNAAEALRRARALPGCQWHPEALRAWRGLYVLLPKRAFTAGWEERTLEGHAEAVSSVFLSRDGRYALSGSRDQTLKLWDVASGRCLRTLEGHTRAIGSVALSGDACYALSGSNDCTLRLWEIPSGCCLRTFEGHTEWVYSVSLSANGRYALSGSADRTLKFWDVSTGRCLRTFEGHSNSVYSVVLSANGRYALSGSLDKSLKLWDVSSGRCLRTFEGHANAVYSLVLSSDGRHAISGSSDATQMLWDVSTGRCLRTFETNVNCWDTLAISDDCRYALSGRRRNLLELWEVSTGRCLWTFEGHTGGVTSVVLGADGCYALSGSDDKTLKLWALDWQLEDRESADWDEAARPYLEIFLWAHTPNAQEIPMDRDPNEADVTLALARRGQPVWGDRDFERLLHTLGCAGYGWLRSEGVREKLEEMAAKWQWQGSSPLSSDAQMKSPIRPNEPKLQRRLFE